MAPPDTSLPSPLYPFPLCPHGISCQLGSFPPLFAAPVMQHRSRHQRGFWPPLQVRLAAAGKERGRKGKENSFCISHTWMEAEVPSQTGWLSQNVLWRWKGASQHFLQVTFWAVPLQAAPVTAAAEPLHVPSITEWQGPGSKENRQIPKRNSGN